MATAKKAPARKAPAKKAPAKKATAKKAAARKTTAKKSNVFSFKSSTEKAVNVYLGALGKGFDLIQDNIETARKENDKRVKELEKRGAKLRTQLSKRIDKAELPQFDSVVGDVKAQFDKVQDQVEDVVESVKDKLNTKAA